MAGADGDLSPALHLGRDPWGWEKGFGRRPRRIQRGRDRLGIKRNILRLLAGEGCKITVVPHDSAEDIWR